jgi:hypothetical protein
VACDRDTARLVAGRFSLPLYLRCCNMSELSRFALHAALTMVVDIAKVAMNQVLSHPINGETNPLLKSNVVLLAEYAEAACDIVNVPKQG